MAVSTEEEVERKEGGPTEAKQIGLDVSNLCFVK
jgi:hypothetical protein